MPTADGEKALRIKVVPGASRTRLAGLLGDRLKVQVAAPPEDGKANKALCQMLAKALGVGKGDVNVTAGRTQPQKIVTISGLSPEQVAEKLET